MKPSVRRPKAINWFLSNPDQFHIQSKANLDSQFSIYIQGLSLDDNDKQDVKLC